jgi:hypothetical protein
MGEPARETVWAGPGPSWYAASIVILAEWTAHPAKSRPRDVALMVAVIFLTAGAVMMSLQSAFLTVLAVVILLVGVAPFWLPTTYVLTDIGVEEHRALRTKTRDWKHMRRYHVGPGAALVSPFANPSWMDRYRGLIMYLDGADRDKVAQILEEHVSDEEREPAS